MAIWIAIHPQEKETRILVNAGGTVPLLKARLATRARHPRALPTLLEAIALWQGEKVHGVLVADEQANTYGTNLFSECFDVVDGAPLYELRMVGGVTPKRRRDLLTGLGDFTDLQQWLLGEVAQ